MKWLVCISIGLALLLLTGCGSSGGELSADDRSRLDSLDATGVVRAYFESGDQATEFHLSGPEERQWREQPDALLSREREGGISDLVIEGGREVEILGIDREQFPEQRQFTVSYTSPRANDIGEPAGPRFFFVYVGQGDDGAWRVLSIGTGP